MSDSDPFADAWEEVRTGQTCSGNSFSMTPELSAVLQFRACWGRGYLQGLPCHRVLLQHYLVSFWTQVDLWLLQCSVIMLKYAKLLFWTGCLITWCLLDLVLGKWAIIYHLLDCQSSFYRSLLCLSSAILPPPPIPGKTPGLIVSRIHMVPWFLLFLFPLSVPFCCSAFELRKP